MSNTFKLSDTDEALNRVLRVAANASWPEFEQDVVSIGFAIKAIRAENEILKKAILNTLGDQPYLATEAVEACEHLRDALRKCDA